MHVLSPHIVRSCANDIRGLPVFDCFRMRAGRPGSSDRLLRLLPAPSTAHRT